MSCANVIVLYIWQCGIVYIARTSLSNFKFKEVQCYHYFFSLLNSTLASDSLATGAYFQRPQYEIIVSG